MVSLLAYVLFRYDEAIRDKFVVQFIANRDQGKSGLLAILSSVAGEEMVCTANKHNFRHGGSELASSATLGSRFTIADDIFSEMNNLDINSMVLENCKMGPVSFRTPGSRRLFNVLHRPIVLGACNP